MSWLSSVGGIFQSLFNSGQQAIGSGLSALTQAGGQDVLRQQIPKTQAGMDTMSNWAFNASQDVLYGGMGRKGVREGGVAERAGQRMSDATAGFDNTEGGKLFKEFKGNRQNDLATLDAQQAEAAAQHKANVFKAEEQYRDVAQNANELIDRTLADSQSARDSFNADVRQTLDSMKKDVAENMSSIMTGNISNARQSVDTYMDALAAEGKQNDPIARAEAEMKVKSNFAKAAGEQATALRADYNKRLTETNLHVLDSRVQSESLIRNSIIGAFGTAGTMKNEAAQNVNLVRDSAAKAAESMAATRGEQAGQVSRDISDAWKGFQTTEIMKAQAQNQVDMEAASMTIDLIQNHAAQNLATQQLALSGYQVLAGMINGMEWSVPQLNFMDSIMAQRAIDAQSSGGSSFGISTPLGGFSTGNS